MEEDPNRDKKNPLTVIFKNRNDKKVSYNVQFCSEVVSNVPSYKGYIYHYYIGDGRNFDYVALGITPTEEGKKTIYSIINDFSKTDLTPLSGRFEAKCGDVINILANRYSEATSDAPIAGMLLTNVDNSTDQIFVKEAQMKDFDPAVVEKSQRALREKGQKELVVGISGFFIMIGTGLFVVCTYLNALRHNC